MSKNSVFNQLSLVFNVPTQDAYRHEIQEHQFSADVSVKPLYDLLGPMGCRLQGIFRRMELAEGVIERMKRLNPTQCDLIHNAFGLLHGTPVLEEAPERLYVAHCQEIVHRLTEKVDTRLATMSELIAAISGVSLITPLKRHAIYLYWDLFQLVFPDEAPWLFGDNDPVAADEWDKRLADDLRAGLGAKLTDASRILKSI